MQDKIIHSLKNNAGYLSGEEISRGLKISRAGIWKHIEELRYLGYKIEALPRLGYRIETTPDKLLPWEIKFNLDTKAIGQNIVYRESTSSTMDEAFRLGLEGAVHGTLVCAETQTKGRGRMGRTWISPSGKGIYASVLLRPKVSLSEVSKITLVAGIAVCEAINKVTGLKSAIKWPNDIFINGKKTAGILTELNAEMDRIKFVIVGIGINVNTLSRDLPAEATSLKLAGHKEFSRVEILQEILRQLEHWLSVFETKGFPAVRERWKKLSWSLGKRVRFTEPSVVEGQAVDIDANGALVLRKDSGELIHKISGDAIHV